MYILKVYIKIKIYLNNRLINILFKYNNYNFFNLKQKLIHFK